MRRMVEKDAVFETQGGRRDTMDVTRDSALINPIVRSPKPERVNGSGLSGLKRMSVGCINDGQERPIRYAISGRCNRNVGSGARHECECWTRTPLLCGS